MTPNSSGPFLLSVNDDTKILRAHSWFVLENSQCELHSR